MEKYIVELSPGVYSTRGPLTGTRVKEHAKRFDSESLANDAKTVAFNVYGYKLACVVEVES